jgi:hypothetical protein
MFSIRKVEIAEVWVKTATLESRRGYTPSSLTPISGFEAIKEIFEHGEFVRAWLSKVGRVTRLVANCNRNETTHTVASDP